MKGKAGVFSASKYGLIIVLFLMPFINVSCSGVVLFTFSGMDLATGTTIEIKEPFSGKVKKQKLDADPLATLALLCAIAGLLVSFQKKRPTRVLNAALGGSGALFLLLYKNNLDKDLEESVKKSV